MKKNTMETNTIDPSFSSLFSRSRTTSSRRASASTSALLAAMVLAGCASSVEVDSSRLPVVPQQFREGQAQFTTVTPASVPAAGRWWEAFSDPALAALLDRVERENTSVQAAAARLQRSRAVRGSVDANRWPQVGASAGVARKTEAGAGGRASNLGSAGLTASYEVDLFGRLSQESQAASLDVSAREALLQAARLLAQAEVADNYFALRALDVERAIVNATAQAYANTLRLVERRYQAGDVAELDVARVRTELASTEAEGFALDERRAALEHSIALLLGTTASEFSLPPTDWKLAVPTVPPGVPSQVLARRPDVHAAMHDLRASQARVGAAQAAWFPSVSLTAAGGFASPELSDVFKWSARTWSVAALLNLPLIDGGRRQANIDASKAALDESVALYRERVLTALKEVEDSLSSLRLLADQARAQEIAIASASRATSLSESRYRNGLVSQLDLLDAQRSELRNRRQAVQVQAAQYRATVGLIRALGGGWEQAS